MSGVEELLRAVREGRTPQVPALVAALGPAERRACLPALKELRKELRGEWSTAATARAGAVLVAGAGCHAGPAGAAAWIGGRDFAGRSCARHPALGTVVEAQPVEWQIEVVNRLAARRGSGWSWDLYPLIERTVRRTGCPVPATEAFTGEWLDRVGAGDGRRDRSRTLLEHLREDAFTPLLAPRVFELADVGWRFEHRRTERPGDSWPAALTALAAEGRVDRAELIDRCLARLVRGGKPGDQRAFLGVLAALAPSPDEYAKQVRSLVAMLDTLSVIAGHAQQVLSELDAAGLVEPEVLAEASAVVLFRTEKKLVRAQLGWLDKAAKRSPERAGPVVLAAAEAFGHPDSALQERALAVVARHLRAAGEAVLPDLRLAAEGLNPAHHARAGELLGAPVGGDDPDTGWSELLPPAPVPRPLGEPIATAAEVAEELSVLLAAAQPEVADFERTLDGLVRHAHLDRAALAEALAPVLRVHPWTGFGRWHDCGPEDVLYVAAVIAGAADPRLRGAVFRDKNSVPLRGGHNTVYGNVFAVRLTEAAERVMADRPPLLLATPTDTTGALSARALVDRLGRYQEAGVEPGEADLHAALLRLTVTADEAVLAAADRLTSPAGRWTARWLREGGLPGQPSERVRFAPPARDAGARSFFWERRREHQWEGVKRICVAQPGVGAGPRGPAGERLGAEFRALLAATEPSVVRASAQDEWLWRPTAHWAAVLPHHREELAARWLDGFADGADREQRGAAGLLPVLAEAGGPAGLALHLALAYGLGARFPEDRTAAVDALLVLAARGCLDGGLLGRELGELVTEGTVKPNRLAQALTAAADTGAYGTVWSVLAPALPAVLAGAAGRGTGELVALAADCARRSSARGPIPEVTEAAARPGTARLVKEARALRDILAG